MVSGWHLGTEDRRLIRMECNMLPRITISENNNGELEIWLNELGRDLLVRKLVELNEDNDHFHLSPADSNLGVSLRTKPYNHGDKIFEWGKVLFRTDQWDAEFFPHVLDASLGLPSDHD